MNLVRFYYLWIIDIYENVGKNTEEVSFYIDRDVNSFDNYVNFAYGDYGFIMRSNTEGKR